MLGDMLAQRLEGKAVVDFVRVVHLGMYGFMLDGPVGHIWYKYALYCPGSCGCAGFTCLREKCSGHKGAHLWHC
jgi:hypothetical protein